MASWDEDALTMAVEAARDALRPDDDRSAIDALYFASTTARFTDA
jgi:3-hydroxy-3-methylglutaryl CoA synthase